MEAPADIVAIKGLPKVYVGGTIKENAVSFRAGE